METSVHTGNNSSRPENLPPIGPLWLSLLGVDDPCFVTVCIAQFFFINASSLSCLVLVRFHDLGRHFFL